MNYTSVAKSDGTHLIASAAVLAADGITSYTVGNNALNAAGGSHLIFTPTVAVAQIQVVTFRLSDVNNRVFQL